MGADPIDVRALHVRDATADDIPALVAIGGSEAMHRDRIAAADGRTWRYLVGDLAGGVAARACLLFGQPPLWPTVRPLPKVIDLRVRADLRGRGIGSAFLAALESLAAERGSGELWISVDPDTNTRAMALYRRLGYEPCPPQPVWATWQFRDSAGQIHQGEGWDATMRKRLPAGRRDERRPP